MTQLPQLDTLTYLCSTWQCLWFEVARSKFLISFHYLNLASPSQVPLLDSRRPGLAEPQPVGGGNKLWITYITVLTKQGHWGPPRMRDQLNAGATAETAQTWKTVHTRHTLIHSNKTNMKWCENEKLNLIREIFKDRVIFWVCGRQGPQI